MICGLITTKYLAVMIGPTGMAFTGQFNNTTLIITVFASTAILSGVVKYIAETQDLSRQKKVVASATFLVLITSTVVSLIVILLSRYFSNQAFATDKYQDVFIIYGVFLIFPAINGVFGSIINGLGEIKKLAIASTIGAVFNVLTIVLGARYFGIKGVLLAQSVSALLTFSIFFFIVKKIFPISLREIRLNIDKSIVKLLIGFSSMAIVSNLITPTFQLLIRSKLLHNFDPNTAGLWQANTRLSDYYLGFIGSVLGVYYLPKLSSLPTVEGVKKEIRVGYIRIMPIVLGLTLTIWFLRDYIVKYLLTTNFTGMLVLLKWQLIGDIIKVASWLLGYVLVAKAMKKTYIIIELVFAALYVFISYILIDKFGMIGSVYAFCLNYFLYLITLTVVLRKYIL